MTAVENGVVNWLGRTSWVDITETEAFKTAAGEGLRKLQRCAPHRLNFRNIIGEIGSKNTDTMVKVSYREYVEFR